MVNRSRDMRAKFAMVRLTPEIIFIEDVGRGITMSVTNDAEAVVYQLVNEFGNRRIVYKDTMDRWDELLHDGDQFMGFAPYNDLKETPSYIHCGD